MEKTLVNRQFKIELFVAIIITGLACCAAFSNLLFASNDLLPYTSDAMGHMAKVKYVTDCFLRGEFPSWFPYWYNGATIWQYYSPLSYLLMVPVQMLTNNVMLTFKINCFIMIFVGSMGVWFFCRFYVGYWSGVFGAVMYCLQPYILLSLLGAGLLAQGPIFAITPWFLIVILSFAKDQSSKKFVGIIMLTALMILSHAMHAFIIVFCIMSVLGLFIFIKKITLKDYLLLGMAIVFAGILTVFWSLVGVSGLENSGIPYLLPEETMNYTATIDWFVKTQNDGFFYFAIPISIASFMAIIMYAYLASLKKSSKEDNFYILFCIILTLFTIIFSFGFCLPFFKFIPSAESIVPGRILSLTAVSAAVLCAYLFTALYSMAKDKKVLTKIATVFVCLVITAVMIFNMNPYKTKYNVIADTNFKQMISNIDNSKCNFEKGRYASIGIIDSSETFFSIIYNYNILGGWNIEGTTQNNALWNNIMALSTENYNYIAKNFAFWNVRVLLTEKKDKDVINILNKKYKFLSNKNIADYQFYTSNVYSSYFLKDNRDALIVGPGSPGIAITFPYLIKGNSDNILEYNLEELEKYKLIYLCEPPVNTAKEQKNIEKIVTALINKDIKVIIEPAPTKRLSLFNVVSEDIKPEFDPMIKKQISSLINTDIANIHIDKRENILYVIFGLDEDYYILSQNNGTLKNEIIGTKNVGNGKVLFIGAHLSQYLKAVYARNRGLPQNNQYAESEEAVKTLFEDIFKTYHINTNFWPDAFPVEKSQWNYKGGTFSYLSEEPKEVTVSVTYTPRWKAFVDGSPITVRQRENLIVLDLPAGKHSVVLNYGITKYGIMGYAISCAGMVLLLLFLRYYDKILHLFGISGIYIRKYLQL